MKTKSNRIGYVAAMGSTNAEVTGGIDAFAMGVQAVNPAARVYVKVTNSWFAPDKEKAAAREAMRTKAIRSAREVTLGAHRHPPWQIIVGRSSVGRCNSLHFESPIRARIA